MKKETGITRDKRFTRLSPAADEGLSLEQVRIRVEAGAVNRQEEGLTPSVRKIILKNTLTLFNVIYLFLAVVIAIVGEIQNTLFLGIAICNTVMGIIQEIRSKRALDKLSVLAETRVSVVRGGAELTIPQDEIVLDDIVCLRAGDQICADGEVVSSLGLEVDESLLTGESDRIPKPEGGQVLSGSYVTGGSAYVHITAVGSDNYANAITAEAKKGKENRSKLLRLLNLIIRILTIIIIPLGAILFGASMYKGEGLTSSILAATAAMIGIIPGGLVLLTGVTLTVGAMNLAQKRALVQSLPSIETLARVDVLCLDKTGTITDGALIFEDVEPVNFTPREQIESAVSALMGTLNDKNSTAEILRATFGDRCRWRPVTKVPFSSDRKWSGATFEETGSYVIGAPNIVFPDSNEEFIKTANEHAAKGCRVMCLAHSAWPIMDNTLPNELFCEALLILSDSLREDAKETFQYFTDEGVTLKVISGDNPLTVSSVAIKAGILNADRTLDMRAVPDGANYCAIVDNYTVFGHVTPQQKRELIRAMQENGHTTCMTGDGVNDILAMREADCSVAMVAGSSAARSACDFVLMSSSFKAMIGVLREGRRVINNIERVASLYLVNTIYSAIFALLYTFLPASYPYSPIQMTPISALTVGIPSFFLALQANYERPQGRFLANIFEHSFPAALTIVFNTLYLQFASFLFDISDEQMSTMVVFMAGVVGFYLLFRIAQPHTRSVKVLITALMVAFVALFVLFGELFDLKSLFTRNVYFYLPLIYFSYHVHDFLGKQFSRFQARLESRRELGSG